MKTMKVNAEHMKKGPISHYQFRYIVHFTLHFKAHDFELNLAFLISWFLVVLWWLNKLEYCEIR